MSAERKAPISPEAYTEEYFRASCGGAEFFRLYGPKVLKPSLAHVLKRAELGPGMRALDVGCGRGELLHHVRALGASGVGTDYSGAAVRLASEISGCPVLRCDAKALPLEDASFDVVFFTGVIDHLHDWELAACFKELGRVLKPGGRVLAHTCANRLYYKNWTYALRRGTAAALRTLGLAAGEPSPPRSDEDERLHVNEQSLPSLAGFFRKIGWTARIEPMPNYKLLLDRLYPPPRPPDFPLKPISGVAAWSYLTLLWWPPLNWLLAREFFCVARPARRQGTREP